jgi:serine/threonine protein kinase
MIGQTISHYKILEKLGGGGMGVVYKAQDLKLDRHVALKFLPPEMTRDPEAKERFIHEAKAASALDHNNICTIHEIGETDDGQMFIVMASYEGGTLKSRIGNGKLRIEEASDLAIQIAQGLAEAHQHGIVHRDVKPANILITKSGVAKIVDFGLAKLSGASKLTKTGSTLGTVAYMSPEQLQGGNVDARADIFSVGVVLYEMLTGKTPFRGDHEAALMYSIVNQDPEPLQVLVPDVPVELIHIVARALEKSPEDRYKTMDDLLIDLRRLRRETSKVSMPGFRQIVRDGFTWKHAALVSLSVIIISALAIFVLPSSRKLPEVNSDWKSRTLQMPLSAAGWPCLSSDGNWVAVPCADSNGKRDIYFMNASGGDVRRVTDDSSDYWAMGEISHDGAWIACTRHYQGVLGRSEIAIVPTQGGKVQALCPGFGPIWTIDNQRILYTKGGQGVALGKSGKIEVWSIRRDGTDNRLEFIDPGIGGNMFSKSLSPDGKSVAWLKTFPDYSNDIVIHNLETGSETQITYTKSVMDEVFWTKDNFIIYSSNRTGNYDLWMCLAHGGESIQITRSTSAKLRAQLSADGRKLLYLERHVVGNIKTMNLESGEVSTITSDDLNRTGLSISPENQRLAFFPTNAYPSPMTTYGIEVIDRGKPASPLHLVGDVRTAGHTAWSPDGQWIAFAARPNSVDEISRVCVVSPSSPASFRVIGNGDQDSLGVGRVYIRWVNEHTLEWFTRKQMKTWMSSIENPSPQQFYEDSTRAYPIQNGRYILFFDYRRSRQGWWIDLSPADNNALGRTTKKILGPMNVSVAPDGRFLLYRASSGELQKVSLPDGTVRSLPFRLQRIRENMGSEGIGTISSDGKEIVYIEYVERGQVVLTEDPFVWK